MKTVMFLLVTFLSFVCKAQNPSFQVMDSLNNLAESESSYIIAKQRLIEYEKINVIDPTQKLLFLYSSLKNHDTNFFKTEISTLIQKDGYRYNRKDTTIVGREDNLNNIIYELKLSDWLLNTSDSLFPIWVHQNPYGYEIKKTIDELMFADQFFYFAIPSHLWLDSTNQAYDDLQKSYFNNNYTNVLKVISLADKNKILPNNFDHGVATGNKWEIMLLHCLSTNENTEWVWKLVLPYIDATYFAGKITSSPYILYDQILFKNTGFQYYETLDNVPIKELENFEERKKKYHFKK